jgi:hypothetical protein
MCEVHLILVIVAGHLHLSIHNFITHCQAQICDADVRKRQVQKAVLLMAGRRVSGARCMQDDRQDDRQEQSGTILSRLLSFTS